MEMRDVKKVLKSKLNKLGFEYVKKAYYYSNNDLILVIEVQHSNYGRIFYINYGILIKELHPELEYPKEVFCDIRGRLIGKDKKTSDFNLDECTAEELIETIDNEKNRILMPIIENNLKKFYELNPGAIAVTTQKARNHINL